MSANGPRSPASAARLTTNAIGKLLTSGRYWIYLLTLGAISLVDYIELDSTYASWLSTTTFMVIHEIHDAIGLVVITLAARRFRGTAGYIASFWFGVIHTPYYYRTWPDPGHMARLWVICGVGAFISYLVDLYYKESQERENAYQAMLAARERLNHLDEIFQLEKMNALGRVAAGVAHDFNNILAAITFQAEVVSQQTKDPSIRPGLENIQQAAMDGAETVKRIRDFTRTQPLVSGLTTVNLKEVVGSAVEMSQPQWKDQAQARGATIKIVTSLNDVAPIRGNAAQLRQVLVNLIINAVEAMPRGGTVHIRTVTRDGSVALTVADDGIGMDEETIRRAFEPFFTTKGPHNTGLGLTAAYGIVIRHGGNLSIQSEKGRGTTFTITLPVAPNEREPAVPSPAPLPEPKTLKVLVVDDEPLVADGLAQLLRLQGHQVTMYTDSLQALEAFKNSKYDAVFTDLGMPGMNGWQLCEAIKKLSPQTPVAMFTGWGEDVIHEGQGQLAAVDYVLGKPVSAEKLNEIVRQIGLRTKVVA